MSDAPSVSPVVESSLPVVEPAVPPAVLRKIHHAWIASVVFAIFVAVIILLSGAMFGLIAMPLVIVATVAVTAYGISRRSRLCAIAMLAYFIALMIMVLLRGHQIGIKALVIPSLLLYFHVQGVIGTFAYHRHLKQKVA
ncbi:hypothetical protein ABL849_25215 [Variovorax sp. 375MFSha3.1]|uniref:hypothetical protein n=1 Tax=unclassified Variovorax TaxID=663243 RepID=UPI003AAF029B